MELSVGNRYVRAPAILAKINLHLTNLSQRQSIILLVFFAPYVALQFPASILVRKLGPRLFLSTIVLIWGIVMMVLQSSLSGTKPMVFG